jgi:hypothetical protein
MHVEASLAILVTDRLLRAVPAILPIPIVSVQNANSGKAENGSVDELCIAMTEGTATVNVVAIAPADGLTLCGLKLQVAPVGRPEQAKIRVWLNPFSGETVIVRAPDPAGATVRDGLLSERE